MELICLFDYCVPISKTDPNWADYTPLQLSLLSYFNLHVIWLKLLLPWRFFRLWALIDGIDPPENMVRCISDTPSTLAFWRGWHRSFNRWLLRYMYIPLGGSNTHGRFGIAKAVRNYLLVFTFVALWHDISMTLLVWGWLIVLFMLPEALAGYLFPRRKWLNHLTAYRYEMLITLYSTSLYVESFLKPFHIICTPLFIICNAILFMYIDRRRSDLRVRAKRGISFIRLKLLEGLNDPDNEQFQPDVLSS